MDHYQIHTIHYKQIHYIYASVPCTLSKKIFGSPQMLLEYHSICFLCMIYFTIIFFEVKCPFIGK